MQKQKQIKEAISKSMNISDPSILFIEEFGNYKIWLTTDWHLYLKDRTSIEIPTPAYPRDELNDIIRQYRTLGANDVLIHMGDIVDDEFYKYYPVEKQMDIFREIFSEINPSTKILLRGNNDPKSADWLFTINGFTIYDAIVIDNILLTHHPIDISGIDDIHNVHGHHHGHNTYWSVPFTSHCDLWDRDRKPVLYSRENLENKCKINKRNILDISDLHLPDKKAFIAWRGAEVKNEETF